MTVHASELDQLNALPTELAALKIQPDEFQSLTGLEFSKLSASRQTLKMRQKRSRWQNQWATIANFSGVAVLAGIMIAGILLVLVFPIVWLLKILNFLNLIHWQGLAVIIGFTSFVLGGLGSFDATKTEQKDLLSLRQLCALMDEYDRFLAIIHAVHVKDQLAALAVDNPTEVERSRLLAQLQTMRNNLIKALKVERILRENPNIQEINPIELATDFATLETDHILQQMGTYQELIAQTLEIGVKVTAEMEKMRENL